MADGTTTVGTPVENCPPGQRDLYGLNAKLVFEETFKELAEIRNEAQQQSLQTLTQSNQLALKTLADAQSAANVHLLNVIDSADKISKATINSLANVEANEDIDQGESSDSMIDSIAKTMEQVVTTLAAIQTTMTDVLANMSSGRPPVNKTGA